MSNNTVSVCFGHPDFLRLIREFHESKKTIAAICMAALALGKSSILENRKATTYHLMDGFFRRQLQTFRARVQDESIVVDDSIITSTSPATAIDVAFQLLGMLTSKENCEKVKGAMGF